MHRASKRQLNLLRSLQKSKGRKETGLYLVEGVRLCEELLKADAPAELVLVEESRVTDPVVAALADRFASRGAEVVSAGDWQAGKASDTVQSQGILAAAPWRDAALNKWTPPDRAHVLALDRVSDPGNVGAILRTAAWFGASAVLLGQGCADLLNPKTVRATMGGLFYLPVFRNVALEEALPELKVNGFTLYAAAMDGSPDWRQWSTPDRAALVLGSEAHGVADALRTQADHALTIPRHGAGESLNVAVSAGVFLSTL